MVLVQYLSKTTSREGQGTSLAKNPNTRHVCDSLLGFTVGRLRVRVDYDVSPKAPSVALWGIFRRHESANEAAWRRSQSCTADCGKVG